MIYLVKPSETAPNWDCPNFTCRNYDCAILNCGRYTDIDPPCNFRPCPPVYVPSNNGSLI